MDGRDVPFTAEVDGHLHVGQPVQEAAPAPPLVAEGARDGGSLPRPVPGSPGRCAGPPDPPCDGGCRPLALLVTPGQCGVAPQMIPVLERIRVPRTREGRPRTTPDRLSTDKAYASRRTAATCGTPDQAHDSRAERPESQPSAPWEQRWPPCRLRQGAVQAPQRGRAVYQWAEELPCRRDSLRQMGLRLPQHRHGGREPALAPSPTPRTPQLVKGSSTVGMYGDSNASVCCVTVPRTSLSTRTSFSRSGSSSSKTWRSP